MTHPALPILRRTLANYEQGILHWSPNGISRDANGGVTIYYDHAVKSACILLGIANTAVRLNDDSTEADLAVMDTLGGVNAEGVAAWNDAPGRSKADIMDVLRATIARLENEQQGA